VGERSGERRDQAVTAVDKLVKGARVYIEGSIKLDEWTAQDGTKRSGLSVLSWHCRLAEIGRNKPKRDTTTDSVTSAAPPSTEPRDRDQQVRGIADPDFDDSVPF
jgi:single-stranded DNA-binding protein